MNRIVSAVLIVAFLGITLAWLAMDCSPPAWDDGAYTAASLSLYDALVEHGISGYVSKSLTVTSIRPPLLPAMATPVYLLLGRDPRNARLVNLVFLLLILVLVWRIAEDHGGGVAGWVAVCVAGTMPMIYGLSHWFLTECTLMAVTCAGVWALLSIEREYRNYKLVLLGIACALGLLLKASFPLYVAAPTLYVLWTRRRAVNWFALPAFLLPLCVLAAPWYAVNLNSAVATMRRAGSAQTAQLYGWGEIFSPHALGDWLWKVLAAGPLFYFGLLTLLLAFRYRRLSALMRRGLCVCALWASPALLLAFSHYRDVRYAAPLFPAVAIAIAILLAPLFAGRWTPIFAGLLLAVPFFAMLQVCFTSPEAWQILQPWRFPYAQRYAAACWPHRELLTDLARIRRIPFGQKSTVLLATDSPHFNADNFNVAVLAGRLPFNVSTTAFEADRNILLRGTRGAPYVLWREGGEAPGSPYNIFEKDVMREVRESGRFVELPIARALPDGGVVHVFANRGIGRLIQSAEFIRGGGEAAGVPAVNVTFGDRLRLSGFSMARTAEGLRVRLRWECLRPVERVYRCFVHALNERGEIVNLDHEILNGEPPMALWQKGDVAFEDLLIAPADLPSGTPIRLRFGLFRPETGDRLPIRASTLPTTDNQTAVIAQ